MWNERNLGLSFVDSLIVKLFIIFAFYYTCIENIFIGILQTRLMQYYTVTILKGEKKIEITGAQTTDGFPIAPGGTLSQVWLFRGEGGDRLVTVKFIWIFLQTQTVTLFPRVPIGPEQDGVAVRKLNSKAVNTLLASSTLYADSDNLQDKFGFIVSYRVVIKLSLVSSPVLPKVVAKVPVYIMARKPANITLTEEALSDSARYHLVVTGTAKIRENVVAC